MTNASAIDTHMVKNLNDYTKIIAQALDEMKKTQGAAFSLEAVNLAELQRMTGISRAKLRRLKENQFETLPDKRCGRKAPKTKLTGYTDDIDALLRKDVTNSSVIFDRLLEQGYQGGLTIIKDYIRSHRYLIPPKRHVVIPRGNRGRRYASEPGECYQMDWGFVNVDDGNSNTTQIACFAMICHCCGKRYVEFFPNARQENLFIGMIHAFLFMGIPKKVLTDNMKSVVISRDPQGKPVWQHDYELFMGNIGFDTRLCKPRHPFTKGSVERLVRFVKENFLQGRVFRELTDLNYEAIEWCNRQNSAYHKGVDCTPDIKHHQACMLTACPLEKTPELNFYLCPERAISFDGFISYEGRRFGVPYWYTEKTCRVHRDGYDLEIYDTSMTRLLCRHDVTWSRKDSFCKDQYSNDEPAESPTAPVHIHIQQVASTAPKSAFSRFDFEEVGADE